MDHQYESFKYLLRRAKSFSKLHFYNKSLVNPYTLATYGFKQDQSNKNEGKCEFCRSTIKFDPFDQVSELKDPFDYALKDHEEECSFFCEKQKMIKLNKSSFSTYGTQIYNDIRNTYSEFNVDFLHFSSEQVENNLINIKGLYKKIDPKFQTSEVNTQILLSLFGWALVDEGQVQCEYCGAKKTIKQTENFEFIGFHQTSCYLVNEDCWKLLLKCLIIEKLERIQGQFSRTEAQIKAKNIRTFCSNIIKDEFTPALNNYKSEIKEIKQIYKGFDSEEGKRKRDYETFDRLEEIGATTEKLLNTGVQRIRVD